MWRWIGWLALVALIGCGCQQLTSNWISSGGPATREELAAAAQKWCAEMRPADAECSRAQVDAALRFRDMFPNDNKRQRVIEACSAVARPKGPWADRVAIEECGKRWLADEARLDEYLASLNVEPLAVTLDHDKAPMMMGRAQSFLARFGTQKIQTATEYVVETYNVGAAGNGLWNAYQCSVNRTPMEGGKDTIEARCAGVLGTINNPAAALMRFMRDGTEPPLAQLAERQRIKASIW